MLAQLAPKGMAGTPAAEGVIQHAHVHARSGTLGPRRGEPAAGAIVVDDVVLEVHRAVRAGYQLEHRLERIPAHGDVTDNVARNRSRAGGAIESARERVCGHPPRPNVGSTGRSA